MRSAVKLRLRNLNPAVLPSSNHQAFGFSQQAEAAATLSESTSKAHRTQLKENAPENDAFSSISQVNRSNTLITNSEISSEVSIANETRLTNAAVEYEKPSLCMSTVCENARENSLQHTATVVHQIVEILFSKVNKAKLEERLESSVLRFDSFIVERVLKRSFKKPYAARILFSWVKQKDGFHPTTEIYHTMLQIAGEAKDIEWLEELVEGMENSSCEKNAETWRILISHFAKSKLVVKALMCFRKMKRDGCEPDCKLYLKLIDFFCSSGKPDIAMELYKETVEKKMVLNVNTYKTLMTSLANSGDAAAVHSIADDMIQLFNIRKHIAFGHMVNSFCSSGKFDEALETMRRIKTKTLPLVPQSYEALVKGLSEVGRVDEALEIVDIMKERGVRVNKIYDVIIDACLSRNNVSKALDLFNAIKDHNRVPSLSVYIQLIEKHFELNQYEKGWELFNELLEKGTKLNQEMMLPMFLGRISRSEISETWRMLRTMKEKGVEPYYKFYSTLIDELVKVGRTDEIINVLNEMQTSDVVIRDDLFERVISYLEENGDLQNLETVKNLKNGELENPAKIEVGIRSTELTQKFPLLSGISQVLSSSLNRSSLKKSLKRYSAEKYTPESVFDILRNCKLHGQAALTFFDWVGKQNGYSHTTETYEMAINIAGNCKCLMHMRSLFYEMRRNGVTITPNTWTILIMQCARNGVSGPAMEIFEEMKANGFEPTGNIYKFLIISLCNKKNRRVNEALRYFQEMTHSKHVPSKDLSATLLDCLCETNRLKDARKCVDDLTEVNYSSELSYSLYIRALCRSHKLKQALEIANEIKSKGKKLDSYAHASLVHGFLRGGNFDAAVTTIDDMKQVGVTPTVHVYTPLMFHFFKKHQTDRAMEIFEKMKSEGCDPTVVTYSVMVQGFINCGKIDDACRFFDQMKEKGFSPGFRTYETLISGLCCCSRPEEAVQLLNEMSHNGIPPSLKLYQCLTTLLDSKRKHGLAREIQQKQQVFERRRFGVSSSGSYF